jgi:hypothetical protein
LIARTGVGRAVDRAWQRPVGAPITLAAVILLAATATSVALRRPWQLAVPGTPRAGVPSPYPVGPVDYLERHDVRGNLFTPFIVGAYVSWTLHARIKVSLDSRYEVAYPADGLERNLRFYDAAPDWRAILERDPTDLVLMPRGAPIVDALATQPGWRRIYDDDGWVLAARAHDDLPVEDRRGIALIGRLP